jgi:hypothetical protein
MQTEEEKEKKDEAFSLLGQYLAVSGITARSVI